MNNEAQERTTTLALARRILSEGRAFKQGWYDDGDCESGLRGGAAPTVAWGQLRLSISQNGSCYLEATGYPVLFKCVYGTFLGSGHWGGCGPTHWVDTERKAIAEAVKARCEEDHFTKDQTS